MSARKNAPPRPATAPRGPSPSHAPRPTPPPVYRPHPLPRVLQTGSALAPRAPQPAAPLPTRPQTPPKTVQPKPAAPRPAAAAVTAPKPVAAPRVVQRRAASPARAGVVQAAKFYPNLHPGAVERVEPGSLFRLESFTDQYRLRKTVGHGAYVPNQLYNFVRTTEGQMLLHNRYRHPSIAEGRQVLYAGEAFFNNGRLEWWSNGSGHYQPDADDAAQAALPMDNFFTYQQVIKGEHKRRRG
jgi:hypothetical protein